MAADPLASVDGALAAFAESAVLAPGRPLAVAYSGGADSTALLLACVRRWPGQVRALHVHHGLQAAADDFERHGAAFCAGLGVPFASRRVQAHHAAGDSPEDAARRARYAALAALAHEQGGITDIALAQHADDQAETLLLALSRGAGLPGLAAMPAYWQRDGLAWHRPLLGVPGAVVRHWLAGQGLKAGADWVEDPTNTDERFTRNRIRAHVLPALAQAFGDGFLATFSRSAAHAAEAQGLLAELAAADLDAVGRPPRIAALQALGRARQANALRAWLLQAHGVRPSTAQLDALLRQVAACTTRGHRIRLKVGLGFVERRGEVLGWYNP